MVRTRTVVELECKRCGYLWVPVKEHPKKCPKCQSLRWDDGETNKRDRK
jgi:predicted Zn-ribbon and HTH transcriptional regulator